MNYNQIRPVDQTLINKLKSKVKASIKAEGLNDVFGTIRRLYGQENNFASINPSNWEYSIKFAKDIINFFNRMDEVVGFGEDGNIAIHELFAVYAALNVQLINTEVLDSRINIYRNFIVMFRIDTASQIYSLLIDTITYIEKRFVANELPLNKALGVSDNLSDLLDLLKQKSFIRLEYIDDISKAIKSFTILVAETSVQNQEKNEKKVVTPIPTNKPPVIEREKYPHTIKVGGNILTNKSTDSDISRALGFKKDKIFTPMVSAVLAELDSVRSLTMPEDIVNMLNSKLNAKWYSKRKVNNNLLVMTSNSSKAEIRVEVNQVSNGITIEFILIARES